MLEGIEQRIQKESMEWSKTLVQEWERCMAGKQEGVSRRLPTWSIKYFGHK